MEVTEASLLSDLKDLGVSPGQRLVVHCSLRSLGWVQGGAHAVTSALMSAVGEKGLLLMPTFNHGAPFAPGGAGVYDPAETPSASGLVSDSFWRREGVERSLHPTHPFAAWGHEAHRFVLGDDLEQTMGPRSTLGRLVEAGGHLLNLGTTHATSTAKHVAEVRHGARCLGARRDEFDVVLPQGKVALRTSWRYRAEECPITESGAEIEEALGRAHLEEKGLVGDAPSTLTRLDDFVDVVIALLERGTSDAPPCRQCRIVPSQRAEGDWS